MNKNLNRRRFVILSKRNIYILLFILISILLSYSFFFQKNTYFQYFENSLEQFSKKYNYQLKDIEITGLQKIKKNNIIDFVKDFLDTSIFLLPLELISKKITENVWVKNVKLNIDYKNTLFIEILEYAPIGIYEYNNKYFYFNKSGKIITQANYKNIEDEDLMIFSGKFSNLNALLLINIIDQIDKKFKNKITKLEYINNRRWDIILNNEIKLKLSEEFPNKSIENYIKVEKNLSETDMFNIKIIDLRNLSKTILVYN